MDEQEQIPRFEYPVNRVFKRMKKKKLQIKKASIPKMYGYGLDMLFIRLKFIDYRI